jgi:hypothetical protein
MSPKRDIARPKTAHFRSGGTLAIDQTSVILENLVKINHGLSILLLCAGVHSSAQSGYIATFVWKPNQPGFVSEYVDGDNIATIATSQANVMVSASPYLDKMAVRILVSVPKESSGTVEVNPDEVHLFKISDKGLEGQERIDATKLAKSRERSARIGAALSGAGAAFDKTTSSGTVTNSDGSTSEVEITTPNTQAQRDAAAEGQSHIAAAQGFGAALIANGLKRNTLHPGERTTGQVLFPKQKKGEDLLIEVVIGNVRYRFPMQLSKKDGAASVRAAVPIELAQ